MVRINQLDDGRWEVYDSVADCVHTCLTHAEALSVREALLRELEAYQYHEGGVDYQPVL